MPHLPLVELYGYACRKAAGPCAFLGATAGAALAWSDKDAIDRKRAAALAARRRSRERRARDEWRGITLPPTFYGEMCRHLLFGAAAGAVTMYVGPFVGPPILCGYGLWTLATSKSAVKLKKNKYA